MLVVFQSNKCINHPLPVCDFLFHYYLIFLFLLLNKFLSISRWSNVKATSSQIINTQRETVLSSSSSYSFLLLFLPFSFTFWPHHIPLSFFLSFLLTDNLSNAHLIYLFFLSLCLSCLLSLYPHSENLTQFFSLMVMFWHV